MGKIRFFIRESWLLIVALFLFGLLIAATNAALSPRIEQNRKEKMRALMRTLFGKAESFELVLDDARLETKSGETIRADIYKALDGEGNTEGFAFTGEGKGFADVIKLVIGLGPECDKLRGFKVLVSNETPGFGSKISEDYYCSQFEDAPAGGLELVRSGDAEEIDRKIVAISGATISSRAVVDIFNKYIGAVKERLVKEGLTGNGG